MRLVVTTPNAILADSADAVHIRAEDASGSFGIRPGHGEFVTALEVSVLSWRDRAGAEHHVALRGATLAVRGGVLVAVTAREAVADDDLHRLEAEVVDSLRTRQSAERDAARDTQRLAMAAIRQIYRYLRDGDSATRAMDLVDGSLGWGAGHPGGGEFP